MHMPTQKKNPDYDRAKSYRERKAAVEQLSRCIAEAGAGDEKTKEMLWNAILRFEGYPFVTAKGLRFKYAVKGNEIFVDRKEKSITRSSVELAFQKALELGPGATGPKKLGVFGASYLYPVFVRFSVILLPDP